MKFKLQFSKDKVKYINEELANALVDITTKNNLVKQHAKVAKEAINGTYVKNQ
jgi:hypothetical protein